MKLFNEIKKKAEEANSIPHRLIYGIREAAELLSVSQRTIWTMIKESQIESVKVRNRRMITHESLKQYIKKLEVA